MNETSDDLLEEKTILACMRAGQELEVDRETELHLSSMPGDPHDREVSLGRCPHCSRWYICRRDHECEQTYGWEHARHGDIVTDRWICVPLTPREYLRLRNSRGEAHTRGILMESRGTRVTCSGLSRPYYEGDGKFLPFGGAEAAGVVSPDPEEEETTFLALLGL